MSADFSHSLEWNDRLLDWLDGDLEPHSAAQVEQHVEACERCRAQLTEFRKLEAALHAAAPPIALDDAFDARVFAQIDAIDEAQRAAVRERIEREFAESLRALSRSWRRTLAFVIPGIVAGIALAFAVAGSFLSAEMVQPLVENAENLSGGNATLINAALTALLGAAIGGFVARWLATVAE